MTAWVAIGEKASLKARQVALIEPAATGCWIWRGCKNSGGYAVISRTAAGRTKQYVVHRLMYEAARGPIPVGLQIDHLCRVRNCVNPDHLEPVTLRENVVRGLSPLLLSAYYKAQSHCRNGHLWTPETTGTERGCRRCLTCLAAKNERRRSA